MLTRHRVLTKAYENCFPVFICFVQARKGLLLSHATAASHASHLSCSCLLMCAETQLTVCAASREHATAREASCGARVIDAEVYTLTHVCGHRLTVANWTTSRAS